MSDGHSGGAVLLIMFSGLIGLATIAIILSQKAQTGSVIQALAAGGSSLIGAAVAPVTNASSGK